MRILISLIIVNKSVEESLIMKLNVQTHIRIFIGRTDTEAEVPILWPPDEKSQLIERDLAAWKDWRQEEKAATEDGMVGWHHRLNGYEFEQTPGDTERQGSLVCYSPWNPKESKMTEWLNNNKHTHQSSFLVSFEHPLTPPTLQYWHLIGQCWMNSSWDQLLLKLVKTFCFFLECKAIWGKQGHPLVTPWWEPVTVIRDSGLVGIQTTKNSPRVTLQ